ncbi:MAG: hypothetical protein IJS49_05525 [Paludibacteraceae bacterium]|nr:hypothetical protein [Paludibacteraceae bacterium]
MKQTNVMSAQEYAQGKELVKRLCNLFGGNFVPDAPVPAEENLAVCETEETEVLPERAWVLLKRARKGGLLDENWRPMVSQRETGILVNIISQKVWGERHWKPFEDLFRVPNLQQHYQKATFLVKFCETEARINAILGL